MTLQLYAHPFSSYCQKVLIALYENDTPFEFRMLAQGEDTTLAEFVQRWPLQRMPVLVDRERTVFESSVVIEYLGLYHPGPVRLVPQDPDAALEVRKMDRVFDNYIMTPMQRIVFDHIRPKDARNPNGHRRGVRDARPGLYVARRPSWRSDFGGRATRSVSPTAPPRRRCSTPTGCIPSLRNSPTCATIARDCWPDRRLPARSTRHARIARYSRPARPTATDMK